MIAVADYHVHDVVVALRYRVLDMLELEGWEQVSEPKASTMTQLTHEVM